MIIHNFEQRSEDWYSVRLGKITGSSIHKFMVTNKKGDDFGETAKTAINELQAQMITGMNDSPDLSNSYHIQRGIELEPKAILEYEIETMQTVVPVGFIEYNELVGGSPDGLVGDDGMIEVKCKNNANHLKSIIDGRNGIFDKAHLYQMQFLMWITERKWCDYVLYNENFPETGEYKALEIFRLKKDDEIISKINDQINKAIRIFRQAPL